jgi:hypothetical protein
MLQILQVRVGVCDISYGEELPFELIAGTDSPRHSSEHRSSTVRQIIIAGNGERVRGSTVGRRKLYEVRIVENTKTNTGSDQTNVYIVARVGNGVNHSCACTKG